MSAERLTEEKRLHKIKSRLERPVKFLGKNALRVGLVGLFGLAFLRGFGTAEGKVGPFEEVRANLATNISGDTVANLGLGDVRFDFFDGMLGIDARSHRINDDVIQQIQLVINSAASEGKNPTEALAETLKDDANDLARKTLVNGSLAALFGGALGGLTAELVLREFKRRRLEKGKSDGDFLFKNLLIGPLMVAALGGINLGVGYVSFDENAIKHPQFNKHDALGALVAAGESAFGTLEDYQLNALKVNIALRNFLELQKNIEAAQATPENLIPILMASDEHSKPCANDRIQALIKAYAAMVVLKAGDQSEWGLQFEASIFDGDCAIKNPEELKVPMVVIGGNHDSESLMDELKQYENVINLKGTVTKLKIKTDDGEVSFLMLGDNDPEYTADPTAGDFEDPEKKAEWDRKEREMGTRLALIALEENPDIIMVHSNVAAKAIYDLLGPDYEGTIISGHTHRFRFENTGGLAWVTVPSSGASGLRGFEESGSSNVNGWLISYFNKETKKLEKITRFYIDNYGSICTDDIFIQEAPFGIEQQLSCDVARAA